jgi:hypothetical protein
MSDSVAWLKNNMSTKPTYDLINFEASDGLRLDASFPMPPRLTPRYQHGLAEPADAHTSTTHTLGSSAQLSSGKRAGRLDILGDGVGIL